MNTLKTLFLIEDDPDDQEFFIDAIRQIKNVTLYGIAGNGKEALGIMHKSDLLPDIIFSDINMSVMDGIECLIAIVNNPKTKNIPVVMLTSASDEIENALRLGAIAFIEKTYRLQILIESIEYIIALDLHSEEIPPRLLLS